MERNYNACIKHNACDVDNYDALFYQQYVISNPIYQQIGAVIRARRKKLKMTQEVLASELGISRGSLANIETGRQNVLVHQLYKFAATLKLNVIDLLPVGAEPNSRADWTELPMPADLKTKHKEQIARIITRVEAEPPTSKEEGHAQSTKR